MIVRICTVIAQAKPLLHIPCDLTRCSVNKVIFSHAEGNFLIVVHSECLLVFKNEPHKMNDTHTSANAHTGIWNNVEYEDNCRLNGWMKESKCWEFPYCYDSFDRFYIESSSSPIHMVISLAVDEWIWDTGPARRLKRRQDTRVPFVPFSRREWVFWRKILWSSNILEVPLGRWAS